MPSPETRTGESTALFPAAASPRWDYAPDLFAVMIAVSIPWSTTAVGIFSAAWLVAVIPTIRPATLLLSLKRPAYYLPIVFFLLAVFGTMWAHGPSSVRLAGIAPTLKLLTIPILLHRFARSTRGHLVFIAFLVSCTALMALSWAVMWVPEWKISNTVEEGIPLKNAINQNQEFAVCLFGLAYLSLAFYRKGRPLSAGASLFLLLAFLANMVFVALARTALLYILVLSSLFVVCQFKKTTIVWLLVGLVVAAAVLWSASPYLRYRVEHIAIEYQEYKETNRPTSTGQRLAYWQSSMRWIAEAPLIGHGTGSAKQLFGEEAAGKAGAWGQLISNPHNQTLYVAIQWGILGCAILYAMWLSHLSLFRGAGLVSWIGTVIVIQNIVSSLTNSHLFDFHEGWIYVLGVGVAGGMRQAIAVKSEMSSAADLPASKS